MQVTRVAGALGARIDGVDPRDPAAFDDIKAALLEHEVVFFRGANLSEEEQFELGRRFGTPSIFPVQRLLGATEPRMTVIQDGPDSPNAADGWHTDATWLAEPPAYALLHMETPPEVGGDTMWCSATAAYDQLAAPMQELLCSLRVIHDNESFIQGVYAKAGDAAPKIADGLREHYPPVEHPMVRTHPETGRRSIVFAWRFMNRIVGFSEHESKSLLTFIGEWVKEPRSMCAGMGAGRPRHLGRTLDLHRASADHWPQKRVIRRLEIDGDRPFFDPDVEPIFPRSSSRSRTESAQPIAAGRLWRREGIRTPGTREGPLVFKTSAIVRSAIPPETRLRRRAPRNLTRRWRPRCGSGASRGPQ